MKVKFYSVVKEVVSSFMQERLLFNVNDVYQELKATRQLPTFMFAFRAKPIIYKVLQDTVDWFDYAPASNYSASNKAFEVVWFPFQACNESVVLDYYEPREYGLFSINALIEGSGDETPIHVPVPRTPRAEQRVKSDAYDRFVIPKRVVRYLNIEPEQQVYVKKSIPRF